jgi:hypothetical protein
MTTPISIRKALLHITDQLEERGPAIDGGWILGFRLYENGAVSEEALAVLGLSKSGEYWRDSGDRYTERPTGFGDLSVEELEKWRVDLLDQCVREQRVLTLPDAITVDDREGDRIRHGLDTLLHSVPGLRIAIPPELDPKAQVAAWMAKRLLTWAEGVRVLLESYTLRSWGTAAAAKRAETQQAIVEGTEAGEQDAVLRQLAVRYGPLASQPQGAAFPDAVRALLEKVFR